MIVGRKVELGKVSFKFPVSGKGKNWLVLPSEPVSFNQYSDVEFLILSLTLSFSHLNSRKVLLHKLSAIKQQIFPKEISREREGEIFREKEKLRIH